MSTKNKKPEQERQFVFNAENVIEITDKINDGYQIKRYMNPWYKNEIGIRRANVSYEWSQEEILEYTRCKIDINYFAETYCKIKREDGSLGKMTLRDYQKDILNMYNQQRFSILLASRQVGKCLSMSTLVKIQFGDLEPIELPLFELVYKYKKNKTFLDHLKYWIYKAIFYLECR